VIEWELMKMNPQVASEVNSAFLGGSELLIVILIILLFIGAKRLPEIGKGIGGAIRSFNDESTADQPPPPDELEEPQPVYDEEGEVIDVEPVHATRKSAVGAQLERQVISKVVREIPIIGKAVRIKNKITGE